MTIFLTALVTSACWALALKFHAYSKAKKLVLDEEAKVKKAL